MKEFTVAKCEDFKNRPHSCIIDGWQGFRLEKPSRRLGHVIECIRRVFYRPQLCARKSHHNAFERDRWRDVLIFVLRRPHGPDHPLNRDAAICVQRVARGRLGRVAAKADRRRQQRVAENWCWVVKRLNRHMTALE